MLENELHIISVDQHNTRDVNKLNDFVLKSELNDVWRLFNAEQKAYIWLRKNPFTARRLDCRPTPFSIIFTTVQFIQWLSQITD